MADPAAIIAGISAERYRRAGRPPAYEGWVIKVLPGGNSKHDDLARIWKQTLSEADRTNEAGVHLFLAHHRGSDYPRFNKYLRDRCYRAVWLSPEISRQYGTETFWKEISNLLKFEDAWREEIRPNVDSPLNLPEISFSAHPSVKDLWRRVSSIGRSRDSLEAVRHVIGRFRQQHRGTDGWRDVEQLIFDRGAAHGDHNLEPWRRNKFTARLPDGFHFDVRHIRNRSFTVPSRDGIRSFRTYTNIDPHGFVRGGH